MKEYIFLLNSPTNPLSEADAQQMRLQWGRLTTRLREEQKFVEGYIFSATGHTVNGSPERTVMPVIFVHNNIMASGCLIIRSNSMDEALKLAQLCPILDFGGTVEVRERMPQPQPQPLPVTIH